MPTRQQKSKTRDNRKIPKNIIDKRIILAVCAAVLLVVAVVLYFVLVPPEVMTNGSPQTVQKQGSTIEPVVSGVSDDFQPALTGAKLQFESADNKDLVKVIVEKVTRADNREITYTHEWLINGQPAGNGSDSISGFKRGDKVVVKVTPFDAEKPGRPRTLVLDVQNTTPKVSGSKETKYDGKVFTAQINASDPDGDTLSYELLSGPEGMTIDKKSGMVNWPPKEDKSGDYPVKVKITDGHGGEITYESTVTIPKEPPPPAAVPKKTP